MAFYLKFILLLYLIFYFFVHAFRMYVKSIV